MSLFHKNDDKKKAEEKARLSEELGQADGLKEGEERGDALFDHGLIANDADQDDSIEMIEDVSRFNK